MLKIRNLTKGFGTLEVFRNFNISIEENMITCIIGPSGCGKTTLLNIIGGLLKADGIDINAFENKTFSYVFQEPRLLEWKTVRENVEFAVRDVYEERIREDKVAKYLEIVEMKDFASYYPGQLSGGMKQRTSIARAFAYPSEVLLMDEPFHSLDVKLKLSVIDAFARLWEEDRRTVVYITHDIDEALMLADRVCLLSPLKEGAEFEYMVDIPRREREYRDTRLESISREIYGRICRV